MYWALPGGRAFRSYCAGFSQGPVTASIPNAELQKPGFIEFPFLLDRVKDNSLWLVRGAP